VLAEVLKVRKADLGCRLASLRLDCFSCLISRRIRLPRLLELFSIHSVAFGGVHKNVVAAGGGSLLRRIQRADFQREFAEFGLFVLAVVLFGLGVRQQLSHLPRFSLGGDLRSVGSGSLRSFSVAFVALA
jgi:hypothetical protein